VDDVRLAEIVAAAASRQPRALLAAARVAVQTPDELPGLAIARATLLARLADIGGRPATALARELQQLGGASASDERLLSRLGWTRPYATRMLRRLEAAGLLVASERPGPNASTGGRPRRIYQLKAPVL
jgi:hypothetical protein